MKQPRRWVDSQETIDLEPELICPQCQHAYTGKGREEILAGKAIRYCSSCQFPLLLVAGKYQLLRKLYEDATSVLFLARHQ